LIPPSSFIFRSRAARTFSQIRGAEAITVGRISAMSAIMILPIGLEYAMVQAL
jgi:hypothetical protein